MQGSHPSIDRFRRGGHSIPSLRAAIEHRAVVLVAVDKLDGIVWLDRESHVAHQRPGRKLAFDMRINAFAVALGIKERADADLGIDLLGGDFHLQLGKVAAVALARDILRVISSERKIVLRRSCSSARGQGKTDAPDKWMDDPHFDPLIFLPRAPGADSSQTLTKLTQRANRATEFSPHCVRPITGAAGPAVARTKFPDAIEVAPRGVCSCHLQTLTNS